MLTAMPVGVDSVTLDYTLGVQFGHSDSFSLSQEYGVTAVPGALTGLAVGDTSILAGLDATPGIAQRLNGETDLIP